MRRLFATLGSDPVPLFIAAGLCAALVALFADPAAARVVRVGPGGDFATPSLAAAAVADGDVVEVMAGEYVDDHARWEADRLTLRAVGGRAHIRAETPLTDAPALWVIEGDHARVIGLEFSGARARHGTAAGLRAEGRGLAIIDGYFHDNDIGLAVADMADSIVTVDSSEFAWSRGHNLDIGRVATFILRFSASHHAGRHGVDSRAAETVIAYNEIADMGDGTARHLVALPEGGRAALVGNVIQKGPRAGADALVAVKGPGEVALVNNTLVSLRDDALFIANDGGATLRAVNSIFWGGATLARGPLEQAANLVQHRVSARMVMRAAVDDPLALVSDPPDWRALFAAADPGFRDIGAFDFRLRAGSPAIDAGIVPLAMAGLPTRPVYEYVHPRLGVPRLVSGPPDIGAYEYAPQQARAD